MHLVAFLLSLSLSAWSTVAQLLAQNTTFDANSDRLTFSTGCRVGNATCSNCHISTTETSTNWRECTGGDTTWIGFRFYGVNFAIYGPSRGAVGVSSWSTFSISIDDRLIASNLSTRPRNHSASNTRFPLYNHTIASEGPHEVNITISSGIFLLDSVVVDPQPTETVFVALRTPASTVTRPSIETKTYAILSNDFGSPPGSPLSTGGVVGISFGGVAALFLIIYAFHRRFSPRPGAPLGGASSAPGTGMITSSSNPVSTRGGESAAPPPPYQNAPTYELHTMARV